MNDNDCHLDNSDEREREREGERVNDIWLKVNRKGK